VTDDQILHRIRHLAPTHPDHRIAEVLNAKGIHTQTGKVWTYERVLSIRKQHHIPTGCPIDSQQDTPRGDGLVPVKTAAKLLNVSPSLVHLWANQGVLHFDQRVKISKRWVRVDEDDLTRLNGSLQCDHLPTFAEIMKQRHLTRDEVWALVRDGHYLAYRVKLGKNWQWRLEASQPVVDLPSTIVSHKKGISHYE
jgi:hypothetical protein